mmetsp:Transcript_35821/g.83591  ORF Transcript_35821/g.83591 Transcript_35821/m.83591 type:complete len:240 (-) Transcript_35821:1995-2714(-)
MKRSTAKSVSGQCGRHAAPLVGLAIRRDLGESLTGSATAARAASATLPRSRLATSTIVETATPVSGENGSSGVNARGIAAGVNAIDYATFHRGRLLDASRASRWTRLGWSLAIPSHAPKGRFAWMDSGRTGGTGRRALPPVRVVCVQEVATCCGRPLNVGGCQTATPTKRNLATRASPARIRRIAFSPSGRCGPTAVPHAMVSRNGAVRSCSMVMDRDNTVAAPWRRPIPARMASPGAW